LRPSLSIIIPAYNEELRLASTLEKIRRYLKQADWSSPEILVVDDGSTDATAAVAGSAPRDIRTRVLRNPGNRGKGYAVRHGMLEAAGEWLLFTDADLSAPIEELETLWTAVQAAGASIAFGSRALNRSLIGVHQSSARENAGRVFNLLAQAVAGVKFHDTQCGFKLFGRTAARDIFRRQRLDGFGFDVEVLFIAGLLGYKSVEVPVHWNHVPGTKVGMIGGLMAFADLARIRWYKTRGKYI
jgi:dolichyl-phosphate beta-glucosyltransferase